MSDCNLRGRRREKILSRTCGYRAEREWADDPRCYSWILSHLFGTARMAARPSAGVVGHDFAVHGVSNLVVADSSVFPTNLGVNPQHAIMAVSRLCAERLAERRS